MHLAIAQKNYINQGTELSQLRSSLSRIHQALKAFEAHNKHLAVKTLYKAYAFLPRDAAGLRITADITESLIQMQAYKEALQVGRDMENQQLSLAQEDPGIHFSMFRIFSNAAEAHEQLGNHSQAHRFSKMALDHQQETQESVDLEMLQLFMK